MEARFDEKISLVVRLAILATFLVALPGASAVGQDQTTQTAPAQANHERFWLAGRYDGNRVIVYFDAVKFKGTLSSNSHELTPAIASWFFDAVRVSESYAVRFQNGAGAEHFSLGEI
jgi:hypothetical protein